MNDSSARLTIRLLGAPQILVAGNPLALNHLKAQALAFYLAVTGQPHTRDHLATLLWSESSTREARHSLRSSLYRLRMALRSGGAVSALIIAGDQVQLQLDEDECDVTHFRQLLSTGGESALARAAALYRGPLLQGFAVADAPLLEDWMRFEETRLSEAYLDALDRLASWAEDRQEWGTAIGYVQRIVQVDPLAEAAQRRLMRLYLHEDAVGLAVRQYQQFKALLQQELGLAPSPETRALFNKVLRHTASRQPAVAFPTRQVTRQPQMLPFVGRAPELTRLLAISHDTITGHGVTVLLQGEAGIGKSRLLDQLAGQLSAFSPPWLILRGNCSPFDDLLSYGPLLEALQSVAEDDLANLVAESSRSAPDARGRFFWQVLQALRSLAASAPLVLAIEDLHWANSSTLNLFSFLAMRLYSVPVMLVGTVESVTAIPSLQRLLTLGRRQRELHLLSLAPLPLEAVNAVLSASGINPGTMTTLADWLHERSGGSPFILAEILAHLRAEAILTATQEGWQLDTTRWLRWRATFTLPETTFDLVDWRLSTLSPAARLVLDVLAVSGQPLAFALLRQFPDIEADRLLSTVDDLVTRGFVVESSAERIALPHHLMREALLHRLSNLRRRTIHRQLAEALEACPALQPDVRQIALHAVAGEDVPRARRYGLQVLDRPQDYAGAETVDFIHHLHDLLAPIASLDEMLHLTSALGRLHQSLGQLETAAHWQRRNLDIAQEMGDPLAQAAAYFETGELALVTNDYVAAIAAAQAGLAIAEATSKEYEALAGRGHRLMGAALVMKGSDLDAAGHHLQQAVTLQRITGNLSDLCATLFELGNVAAQRGELGHAIEFYTEAGSAAESGHVHYFLALAHNNLAYHNLLLGQPKAARQSVEQGLRLAETFGMLGALQYLYSTQGEINMYLGEWAAAADSFQRGLALAEELGHLERQAGYRAGLALVARDHEGDLERAVTLLKEALALIEGQGYEHLRTEIRLRLAETLMRLGHTSEAWPQLEAALVTARSHDRILLTIQGERLRAGLLACGGDWPGANTLFAQTLDQASHFDLLLEVARTQAAWGKAALDYSPNPDEGRALLAQAHTALSAHDARAELHILASDLH